MTLEVVAALLTGGGRRTLCEVVDLGSIRFLGDSRARRGRGDRALDDRLDVGVQLLTLWGFDESVVEAMRWLSNGDPCETGELA